MTAALEFRAVNILFAQDLRARRNFASAQAALSGGATRAEVAAQYRVIAGVIDASLRVESGGISVLMGLSGSGKSTLLRAANGLNQTTSGQVLLSDGDREVDVASCDAASLRRVRRRRVAMVFQQFGLLPWRTVRELSLIHI